MKKAVAFAIVFCMCINSYGAIVSDNDGSAFITKAEFDSLKNTFQSQIDTYNSGIDSKIDGAIAAYLAGVKTGSKEQNNIIFNDWKEVVMRSTIPAQTWYAPQFKGTYKWVANVNYSTTARQVDWASHETSISKNYSDTRILVDAGTEGSSNPTYVTWDSVCTSVNDTITVALQGRNDGSDYNSSFCSMLGTGKMYGENCGNFGTGYWTNLNDNANKIWKTNVYYYCTDTTSRSGSRAVANWDIRSATFTCVANDNYKNTKHVLFSKQLSGFYVTDPKWLKHLNYISTYSKTTSNTTITTSGTWSGLQINKGNSWTSGSFQDHKNTDYSGYYNLAYGSTSSQYIPNVGVINKNYSNTYIRQFKDNKDVYYGKEKKTLSPLSTVAGFCVLYAKKDDIVEWEPVFKNTKYNNSSTNFELNVIFSDQPFTNGQTTSGNILVSDREKAKGIKYMTTENKKGKWKFKMEKDSFVYCYFWPANTTYASGTWETTLDIENCKTYTKTTD